MKSTKNNAFNVLPTDEGLLVVVAMYFYAIYSEIVPGVIKAQIIMITSKPVLELVILNYIAL